MTWAGIPTGTGALLSYPAPQTDATKGCHEGRGERYRVIAVKRSKGARKPITDGIAEAGRTRARASPGSMKMLALPVPRRLARARFCYWPLHPPGVLTAARRRDRLAFAAVPGPTLWLVLALRGRSPAEFGNLHLVGLEQPARGVIDRGQSRLILDFCLQ
jgi:hypothetical protein